MSTCSRDRRFSVCMYIFAPFSRGSVCPLYSYVRTRFEDLMHAQELGINFGEDRTYKYFITKLMAQRAREILPRMMKAAGVEPDRCVVIDSEFLFAADESPSTLAVCRSETRDDSALVCELANELGEFDVAHTRYLRSPVVHHIASGGRVLVDTVDTDILFVDTLQVRRVLFVALSRYRRWHRNVSVSRPSSSPRTMVQGDSALVVGYLAVDRRVQVSRFLHRRRRRGSSTTCGYDALCPGATAPSPSTMTPRGQRPRSSVASVRTEWQDWWRRSS